MPLQGSKKSWMDSDLIENWVREQDNKFEDQNRKMLLIVDNCPGNPEIGGLKAIELCFLPPNITSITHPMDQGVIRSLKAKYHSRMIQKIIKAIDENKSIPKVNILDAMKMLTVCWEDVTEETVKVRFSESRIPFKDQANAQSDLHDPFIELRSNMEKLKFLGVDEISEELAPEEFANFHDAVAATDPILSESQSLQCA